MPLNFQVITTPASIKTVAALAHTIWNEHFPSIISQAQVDYMLKTLQSETAIKKQIQEGMQYYLIQKSDHSLGYLGVKAERQQNRLFLSKFYLLADQRGQGLARQSLQFIETLAQKANLQQIVLTCNKYNEAPLAVYQHLGFSITDSIVQDIGDGFVMDDYVLTKNIGSS